MLYWVGRSVYFTTPAGLSKPLLEGIFGRSVSELSVITNFILEFLYDRWAPCLLLGLQMHVFKRVLMLC